MAVRGKAPLFQNENGERRLKAVKLRLCDWLHRAVLRDKEVLAYASAYFQLGPVERRTSEVACVTTEDGRLDIDLAIVRL